MPETKEGGARVRTHGADQLAGTTAMHDLIVLPVPVPDPPCGIIAVRAPDSVPFPGHVVIEHLSCTGRNDRIERPAADAMPLFWRFMITKYGIRPPASPGPDTPPGEHRWTL
jgi:hypothetical protein